MDSTKDILLQTKNIEYIKGTLGKEQWIQVSGHRNMNGANADFWCGLVSLSHADNVYNDVSWDISANTQGIPGFEGNSNGYQYKTNLLRDGFESILYYREFYGAAKDYIEISQEFILLNNLRYDERSKSYWAMYDSGETEEAVKYIDDTTIQIKKKFLRNYATAKQMAILLFFDIRTESDDEIIDHRLDNFNFTYKDNGIFYGLWGGKEDSHKKRTYSVLMGKKVIMPSPIEECGYWPYEKEEKYEDYIIGIDDNGNEIFSTCDPDKLNNYFDSNPGAQMYLTPVFFKREVLQKYINKPELYEIKDGYLNCQSLWGIGIDNHHKDYIVAYLGDLGEKLPESERGYWKSFNIVGEGGLSETSFLRDFCNMFAESNMEDHKFQYAYSYLIKKWNEKYKWDLFLPLSAEDRYNLTQIRIPIGDSQPEFDQLVLSLVKVLIDSLNEKKLKVTEDIKNDDGSINKLEKWLQSKEVIGYEKHIEFLRDIQSLRSSGTGHRKGKEYNKISNKFDLPNKSKIDVFEEILKKANEFLDYMKTTFLD
ncbi:MAG: hypothetical protein IJH31_02510 [Erysipelotrichaceae bacterium]|nr:hypothetical protein [Erysipelotrichaceae bacterium]